MKPSPGLSYNYPNLAKLSTPSFRLYSIRILVSICNMAMELSDMEVEGIVFPKSIKPAGTDKDLELGGAGMRGLMIGGKLIPVTTVGVYIERCIVTDHLSSKWKGKSGEELNESEDFIADIVSSDFIKLARVAPLRPLPGPDFCEKVSHNSKVIMEKSGKYGEAEAEAMQKFIEAFSDENIGNGDSVLFTISPSGLGICLWKNECPIPEENKAEIGCRALGEAVLTSMIGKDGVSPPARAALADRLSSLLAN